MSENEQGNIFADLFEMSLYVETHGFVKGIILWLKEQGRSDEYIEQVLGDLNDEDGPSEV